MTAAASTSPTEVMATRVSRLRISTTAASRDRLMLYVGGALLPLGILVVLLGWIGASHTVLIFEQIPYMISGGQFGQSLVFAGGFIYFAYWMSLLVRESRTRHVEMIAALRSLEATVAATKPEVGAVTGVSPAGPESATVAGAALVSTATGSMYHRTNCQVVANRPALRPVTDRSGLEPCKLCQPDL